MKIFDHIHIVRKLDDTSNGSSKVTIRVISEWAEQQELPVSIDGLAGRDLPSNVKTRILFISVGGDGTMLYTMKKSLKYGMSSVIGINCGSLGFLVEDLDTVDKIRGFLSDVYKQETEIDDRMVLSTTTVNGRIKKHLAVNEFLFSTGSHNAPFNYKILINDKVVARQFGSGVLIATSTGSTAMSLSGGGVIVDPSTNIIQIVPLLSHSLSARPFITTGRDKVSIETTATDRASDFELRADGRKVWDNVPSNNETYRFDFHKYPQSVAIHRPKDWNFFEVLTKKLKW